MSLDAFKFLEPGFLQDGELIVGLQRTVPAAEEKDGVPTYLFLMVVDGEQVGDIHLRAAADDNLTRLGGYMGYNVDEKFRGKRYAERACRLLLPLARAHGFGELWLTCNPENKASRATLERLGAQFVDEVEIPREHMLYLRGERAKCRYRLSLK